MGHSSSTSSFLVVLVWVSRHPASQPHDAWPRDLLLKKTRRPLECGAVFGRTTNSGARRGLPGADFLLELRHLLLQRLQVGDPEFAALASPRDVPPVPAERRRPGAGEVPVAQPEPRPFGR